MHPGVLTPAKSPGVPVYSLSVLCEKQTLEHSQVTRKPHPAPCHLPPEPYPGVLFLQGGLATDRNTFLPIRVWEQLSSGSGDAFRKVE